MTKLESPGSTTYAGLAADDVGQSDERPGLVLLHGLTFDRTMWRPALAELAAIDPGRRAIALDLPGHGESPDAAAYDLGAIVDRVAAAIRDAGLERPVVIGHSGAAGTAAVYAATHPSRGVVTVEGTMNVAAFAGMVQAMAPVLRGPGFADAWSRIAMMAFRLDEVSPDIRAFVTATSRPRQEIVLGYWAELFTRTQDELAGMVVGGAAAIRAAGVPYVSVLGSDPSPEDVSWIRQNLPSARTVVWPYSGHFPHLAHPARFADLLAETATWTARPMAPAGASA